MKTKFCLDEFWNVTSVLNSKYPIFTECFQYSILLIPPGIFIILLALFLGFQKYKCHAIIKVPLDFWYILKLSFQGVIIILLIIEIVVEKVMIKPELDLDGIYILSYTILCLSMILAILQTEIRRRTMHPVCAILFTFWFTITIAYSVRFYSNVIRLDHTFSSSIRVGFIFISGFILFLFLLNFLINCFSPFSLDRLITRKKMPCPEEYSSILSKLTYSWLDVYIYRWFRKDMTDENSFDLRRVDESTRNTNLVENYFLQKINISKEKTKENQQIRFVNSSTPLLAHEKTSESTNQKPGWILFYSLVKVYGPFFLVSLTFKIVHDFSIFAMPFLLKILLQYIDNKNYPYWMGYFLAFAFLFAGIASTITENACFFITSTLGVRIRASLIGMIYRKTLRLSNEIRNKFTSGEIVNLMSVDAERIMNWTLFSWFFISCPLQLVLAIILLYQEMGYSIFAGLGLMVAFIPVNGFVMNFMKKYSETELNWKDKRIKILTEILNGMKVLKMYAWEKSFLSKISNLRDTEMKYICKVLIGWGSVNVLWELLPFLIMLVTFLTYVFSDRNNIINAEKAFVSLTLFNLMRFPMTVFPWGLTDSINAFVSLKRIGAYLVGEELDTTGIEHVDGSNQSNFSYDPVVAINCGSFAWKKDDKIILKNINLEIHKGQLIAIVGKVGTGKSSLISAILGEMHRIQGNVKIQGKLAYVSQEAWIQNKSLKENILFTKDYDEKLYRNTIEACCLISDLDQLPGRDDTEIGERGINLSGGQKQRVSLARAVYQNRDIYLLDDPLSAVDAHVGQHLFENVISKNGLLKNKTRILVTHGLNWLPKVDEVLVLDSNGTISERGSFKELLKNGNEFMQFIQEYIEHNNRGFDDSSGHLMTSNSTIRKAKKLLKQVSDDEDAIEEFTEFVLKSPALPRQISTHKTRKSSASERLSSSLQNSTDAFPFQLKFLENSQSKFLDEVSSPKIFISNPASRQVSKEQENTADSSTKPIGQLIDDEHAMSGRVKWSTYAVYIKSRGSLLFILTVILYIFFTGLQVFSNVWLKDFTEDKDIYNASDHILKNSSNIPYWSTVIRERTEYYMTRYTYIGLAMTFAVCLYWVGFTIGSVDASKLLHKRLLQAILRSPMEFFDTTPSGRILNRFSKDMESVDHVVPMNVSDALMCFLMVIASIIVIITVTPWFGAVIIPLVILYYFIQLFYMPTSRQSRRLDSIASSPVFNHFTETLQGVALIRAFKDQSYFENLNQNLIDKSSKFKFIQMSSIRWLSFRIELIGQIMVFASVLLAITDQKFLNASLIGLSISYSLQITEFLNWLLRQYTDLETNSVSVERIREYSNVRSEAEWDSDDHPPESWPNNGSIAFQNYDLRYREDLPLVLKNLNFDIKGGEKIGVCGRTGAGKSSLNLALFRLVEPSRGVIKIDNLDITKIGLHDLRKSLTILPQDPVIFSGTLRENLDPFMIHSDEDLFQSLETAHLKQWVSTLTEGMDYDCGEGGVNLSSGQKQLLCLARALLRKSKVLILDEATASVDVETDRLVMQTIRDYFRQSTVIIIAHRINTILDSNKIIVMDHGEIIEYDSPKNLLDRPDGIFKSLHDQSSKNDL